MPAATTLTYLDMHVRPRLADVDRAGARPEFADLPDALRRPKHVGTRDAVLAHLRRDDAVLLQAHGKPGRAYLANRRFKLKPKHIGTPAEQLRLLFLLSCGQYEPRAKWQTAFPNALLVTSDATVYPGTFAKVALAVVAEHHRTGDVPSADAIRGILGRYRNQQWALTGPGAE